MYVSVCCLWQEQGNTSPYVLSFGRNSEIYLYIYCLWQEEGNVYFYLPSVCSMSRKVYISIYRLWYE